MKSSLPLILAASLAATPLAAFDVNNMSEDERSAFRDEVRAYLLDNPEVIIEAVNALEARQAEAQAQGDVALVEQNLSDLHDYSGSWVGGNPDGDLTVVEFMDYRCGYCRKAHDEVQELVKSDGNIRYILKEFPILGENSMTSSRFALAVRKIAGDDAYKAAHDALITITSDASEPVLRRLAESLGVDADAVLAEMNSDEITQIIMDTRALAQRLQINGTPTFVFGDQMLRGYVPLDGMRQVAREVRGNG